MNSLPSDYKAIGELLTFFASLAAIAEIHYKLKIKKLQVQPTTANLNYRRGKVFQEHSNAQKAIECFEQAAKEYGPESLDRARTLITVGLIHKSIAQHDKAIECYIEAQAIYSADPKTYRKHLAQIYSNLADAYSALGKNDEASVFFEKANSQKRQVWTKTVAAIRAAVSKTARRVFKRRRVPSPLQSTAPACPPAQTPPVSGSPNSADMSSETAPPG